MSRPCDSLSRLLRCWVCQPREDAAFSHGVWARIAAERTVAPHASPVARFTDLWQFGSLGRVAIVAALLAGTVGSTAAFAYGRLTHEDRQVAAYFRSIDPLQRSDDHASHTHAP